MFAALVTGLPTFKTERLLLRQRVMGDLDDCLAMDRDPLVTRYIPGPWADPDAHRAFVIDRMTVPYPAGLGYWSIIDRTPDQSDDAFLGWVLRLPYDEWMPDEVEIGWRLRRACWGKGYATEAALPIVRHAFDALGLERIVADIDPRNEPSMGVAKKLGFQFVEDRVIDDWAFKSYQLSANHLSSEV